MDSTLITLRTFSLSYQHIFGNNRVPRLNLVHDIEDMFDKDCKIVILEGKEGSGKTDILLQFSRKHPFDSITFFVNPAFRASYRQDYLMEDLGRQIFFFNKNEPAPDELEITESVFNKLTFDLTTSPGRKNKPVYFVLDALDQIEKSDFELLKNVLQNLPWNTNNFYFLISGSIEGLKEYLPAAWLKNFRSLRVPRFTEPETKQLFNLEDTPPAQSFLHEIHNTWKGHPENLSQVKRIIQSGVSTEDFLQNFDISEKNDLLEIEWKRAELTGLDLNSEKLLIVSILAFDDNIRSINRIGSIVKLSITELQKSVSEISFLALNEENIAFVSNSYRQYAIYKLKRFERETNSKLIEFYTSFDDINSILNLPTLFDKNNEWSNIVELLTIDNLDLIISNSRSFSDIKKQINYGYKAAKSLKNSFDNIFRFSLHRSVLIGLQSSDSRKDQIRSFIVLDRPEDAFSVIANSILKEDRLKMLIYFIQYSKIEKKVVDKLIIDEVKDLLIDVDAGYLRENLMDIAVGLAYFLPNEAIQVIEKAMNLKADNSSIEWLMGIISIIANKNKESNGDDSLTLGTQELKKPSFVETFAKSIGYGISEVLPEEIIEEIEKIEKLSDRIFLMRKWIKGNAESKKIGEIINYTINLITQESSSVKPSTEVLYDIVFPIKFFKDEDSIHFMVKRLDDLMITINSPTIGKVMLDIVVIEALLNVDVDEANNRTIALSKFINDLTDVCIKLEAYANLWKMYIDVKNASSVNLDSLLLDEKFLKSEINKLIGLFLVSIADQHEEIQDSLIIFSELDFSFALDISSKLNTAYRRDSACLTCIESYLEKGFEKWVLDDLNYALGQIVSQSLKTEAIMTIFERAFKLKDEAKNFKYKVKDLLPLINFISGDSKRCKLLSLSIILLGLEPTNSPIYRTRYDGLINKLNGFLLTHYNKIDNQLNKTKMGYALASSLGTYNKKLAEAYFNLAEASASESTFEDFTHLSILTESIRIVIRIYSGLVRKIDTSYEKIGYLISLIPSKKGQIMLWSELAVRVYIAGKLNIAKVIVASKIIPVLDAASKNSDNKVFFNYLKRSASSVHLVQPANLVLYFNLLTTEEKEEILPIIFVVLLSNCHETDPFNNLKGSTHFTYQTAIEYINLLEYAENDGLIHHYLRSLTKVVKANPNIFTRIQKGELYQKINDLINRKLPNKATGIKHDGYLISARACNEQLNISGNEKINQNFNSLESMVSSLSSITDRAVVYLNLAEEFENNKKRKLELFKRAFDEIGTIPSIKERISMYETALDLVSKSSLDLFNQYLKIAEVDIYNLDESDQYPTFKKLIDLAYRCDKNIAQRLITSLDTDPAKKKMSEPANDHFEKLGLEKSAESDYSQIGKIKERREKSNFAWNLLAQLNSNKRKARDIGDSVSFLHSASTMPFFFSLPLYEFFIENIIKGDDKSNLLLSFYETANANARLCYNLICSISNKNQRALSYHIGLSTNSIIINPGMHVEAYDFIKNFMIGTDSREIYLIDPYFSEKEMHFLKKIDDWCPGSATVVLSSCEGDGEFHRNNYLTAWEEYSMEVPPSNTFLRIKNQNSKSPFHDRYLILYDKKMGLRMGASINGITGKKTFEISKMLATEVETVYDTVIRSFIYQRPKEYLDQNIKYESFDF